MLGRVPIDHVSDLVPQHPGQLGLVPKLVEQGAGDEDLAAGKGEGIDHVAVIEQVEVEIADVGALAGLGALHQLVPDLGDRPGVGVGARVERPAHLLGHLRGGLKAQGLLVFGGETADVLFFAGDGVELGSGVVGDERDRRDREARQDAPTESAPAGRAAVPVALPTHPK